MRPCWSALAVALSVIFVIDTAHAQCNPTTTTTVPGCGNGVVDPGEQCDGGRCTVLYDGQPIQVECGAPGTIHSCECRGTQCGYGSCGTLCWPTDQCAISPGCPEPPSSGVGQCIHTVCATPADCQISHGCENGLCCVAPDSLTLLCRIDGVFALPCCGGGTCAGVGLGYCCFPAGTACTAALQCCSGSCTAGHCG
jgi:hypothetical protein